jgi:hypothetical protein
MLGLITLFLVRVAVIMVRAEITLFSLPLPRSVKLM